MSANQEGQTERARQVRLVTWIGMVINILLSAFKIVSGIIGSISSPMVKNRDSQQFSEGGKTAAVASLLADHPGTGAAGGK